MNKRGQGIQFNWIFVVIAGVIFLAFFAFFGARYYDLEQSKENAKFLRELDLSVASVAVCFNKTKNTTEETRH